MGTVGDLVAKLFCDSTDFDKNIKKSQKEVQEFKRKTEREAASINNAFSNMGSTAGKLSPILGNVISSFGKVSVVAAAGTAAFEGFKQVIQQSETAMDDLEKKTAQLNGAWEHFTTTVSNGNIFSGITSSLQEAVRLAGELAEIVDNIGTLSGYSKLDKAEVEGNISKLKELYRSGASKEEIAKQIAETKASIVRFDATSDKLTNNLELEYNKLLEAYYTDVKRSGHVGKSSGTYFLDKFSTDTRWRDSIVSWSNYLGKYTNFFGKHSESAISPLKNNKEFVEFLKKSRLYDDYLFKAFQRGEKEGYEYIKDVISIIIGAVEKKEDSEHGIVAIQEAKTAWLDKEKERSDMKAGFYRELNIITKSEKPGKPGKGGSVYTSKQEAPKERTLQDILDDLDKSLAWNKYLAQNLGEDVTGSNLSTLEKTANELKDLLKDTTDEEQRKQILSVLKTMYNVINKPKKAKKPVNSANFEGIYGNEIGNLSLNGISAGHKQIKKEADKVIEDNFKKNIPENFIIGTGKGFSIRDAISADVAREFNYDADKFLKDKYAGEPSDIVKRTIQSIFNSFKDNDLGMNADLYSVEDAICNLNYIPVDNKISSFIPFGELSKFDIPIKYPEELYSSSLASSKFSSGVASIVKKYTGFETFRRDFAKNAYSEFDRLISEGNIITPDNVNEILFQVYRDTIKKYTDNTPNFFKDRSSFYGFINEKTNSNFKDEEKSEINLILGEKNKNALIYQELLNNIGSAKVARTGLNNNLTNLNTNSRTITDINFGTDYIISFLKNDLSNGNIYEYAKLLSNLKSVLIERRKILTEYLFYNDIGENRVKLENDNKNLRLIQLEREKRSNKGVLSEENQKEYEKLKKETSNDFSGFTDKQLETLVESFTRDAEKLKKAIEETNNIRKDLEDRINQTDEIGNRIKKEEDENNVLRERQRVLSNLSNEYMSVADSAYQIGAAFSTLNSKFGDIASVLLNVVGITAEAIGKLIGMATAKGVSNAFSLPWPQNLAAVATVVAAGASAAGQIAGLASKKYATGGIVSGPGTSISDSIPIRVSNGEMILNHRQQSNLFNLLDKGGGTEGKIEFKNKLVGSDIIGSATTYNKRRNLIL